MLPESGLLNPDNSFNICDLPLPDAPSMLTNCPSPLISSIRKLKWSKSVNLPVAVAKLRLMSLRLKTSTPFDSTLIVGVEIVADGSIGC